MPKTRIRAAFLMACLSLAAIALPKSVFAQIAREVMATCFLQVGGETLVDGECGLHFEPGRSIVAFNTSGTPQAHLNLLGNAPSAYGETRVNAPLGVLRRASNTCWESDRARVCFDVIDDMATALLPYEGKYIPAGEAGADWDCGEVGMARGAYRISDGMLFGTEYGCTLSNPRFMEGFMGTAFDGSCFVEGTAYYEQLMVMPWGDFSRHGVNIVSEYGTQAWEWCAPVEASTQDETTISTDALAWSRGLSDTTAQSAGEEIYVSCSRYGPYVRFVFPERVRVSNRDSLIVEFDGGESFNFPMSDVRTSSAGSNSRFVVRFTGTHQRNVVFHRMMNALAQNDAVTVRAGSVEMAVSLRNSGAVLGDCIEDELPEPANAAPEPSAETMSSAWARGLSDTTAQSADDEIYVSCSPYGPYVRFQFSSAVPTTDRNLLIVRFDDGAEYSFPMDAVEHRTTSDGTRLVVRFDPRPYTSSDFDRLISSFSQNSNGSARVGPVAMTVDLNGADDALSTCLEIAPPPAESDGRDQGGASSATASLEARLASERDALIASLRAQYGLGEREGESEFGVSQEQTERLAEEQAERERLAEEQAERERIAAEQAANARGIAAYRRFQELANGSPEMRNLPLAFDFLRVAAEQGYVYAQHDLGYIYEHGQMGVQRSLQEAARWYEMAAAQGFEPSISRLERIAIDGPAYQPGPSTRHAAILTCTNGPNVEVSIMVCLENSVLSIVKNGEVSEYASGRNAHMNALNRFEEAGDFLGDALFIGLPADFLITTRNSARHQFTLSLFVLEVEEGEHWRSITDRTQVCRQHARSYGSTVTCQSPG